MDRNQQKISVAGMVMLLLVMLNAVVLQRSFIDNSQWYKITYITIPLLLLAVVTHRKKIS